jgi:hypothetical protein
LIQCGQRPAQGARGLFRHQHFEAHQKRSSTRPAGGADPDYARGATNRNHIPLVSLNPGFLGAELRMRGSNWTPSIVPTDSDDTIYLVADDFGQIGRAWREADYDTTDLETVIQGLLSGEYSNPIRVVAFNTGERWSEDVSEDVASELRRRCDLQMREVPAALYDFVDRHQNARQLTLRLV